MVNIDSTGFGGAEFAQVVPGVQVGKRLTLENLNERLSALEGVVQQLVEATYPIQSGTAEEELDAAERAVYNGITGRVTRESQEKEIDRLKAEIEDLRLQLADAESTAGWWEDQHEEVLEEYERLRARIDGLLE